MSAFEDDSREGAISMRDVYQVRNEHDDDDGHNDGTLGNNNNNNMDSNQPVNQTASGVFESSMNHPSGSPTSTIGSPTSNDAHFPFDLVFVFDVHARGARDYADGFYRDLTHDGFFACHYLKKYRNGVERIFVGVGASDRILVSVVETFHFTEERTEVRRANGLARIFAQNTRQRILLRYLKLRSYGGPHATLDWMQESKILTEYFCLHDPKEVRDLRLGFTKYVFYPNESFVADVEEYFGEEMAMYFAWLRTLIIFAIPIAIAGCVFFAFEIYDDYASWAMVAAGYLFPVYMQFFHEFWKRREKRLSFEFGTLDLEEVAEVREGFRGTQRMVKWKKEKRVRHQGEDHDTIIVAAGDFELPIQHTVPDRRYNKPEQQQAVGQDPFETEVVEQLDFSLLPENVIEKHYPASRRYVVYGVSIPTSLAFCVAVVVAIYGIQFLRELLAEDSDTGEISTEMSIAVSVLNGVVIVILNTLYPLVTRKLVEWENHRTQEEFEQSYITKLFMFVFVNSYFPLYLASFRLFIVSSDSTQKQSDEETIQNLVIQIFTACVSTVFVSNIQDIVVPFLVGPLLSWIGVCLAPKEKKSAKKDDAQNDPFESSIRHQENEDSDDEDSMSSTEGNFITKRFYRMEEHRRVFEHQVQLAPPQPVSARFMGRIILFGFATIFASIFPLGFVFVLFDAVIVLRVEIIRYLYLMRRAPARQVESIGGWRPAIQFILVAAAVTNACLICFSTKALNSWFAANDTWTARLTIFIASEHIVVFLIFGVEFIIPDDPMGILRIKALQTYLVRKSKNLLTYDAIDPRMPAHYAIVGNFDDRLDNYNCVQCKVRIEVGEWVRKFPCHHHIHDSCLQAFCTANNTLQSPKTAESDINADLFLEGEADCPSCGYHIDYRYFSENLQFKNYAPIRYRMLDYLAMRSQRGAMMKQKTQEECSKLREHARAYGLGRGSFPSPGAPPAGQPPKTLDGSVMVSEEPLSPQSPATKARPSSTEASNVQSPTNPPPTSYPQQEV